MTVSEYLKENKNQIIKIGTSNGSSFLYCGLIDDYTESQLNDILEVKRSIAIKDLNKAKEKFDNFEQYWEKFKNLKIREFERNHFIYLNMAVDKKVMMAYKEKIESSKLKTYEKIKDKIDYNYMFINQWQTINNRKVIETYKTYELKDLDINVLIMDGNEIGKYWTVEEFKKEFNNYRKES